MRIGLDSVGKSYGEREVFREVSWQITAGERWALLGPNGAGKTTLLKVLAGEENVDRGKVRRAGDLRISSVKQGDLAAVKKSAWEYLLGAFEEMLQIRRRLEDLHNAAAAGNASEKDMLEMADLQVRLEMEEGYTLESRVEKVLTGLGFGPKQWNMPCFRFSGGEQMRLKLGRVILNPADLLLLDEPGNHLDSRQREFLAQFLVGSRGTMVIVTHDPELLEDAVDRVAYLFDGRLFAFRGNFESFERQFAELRRSRKKTFLEQQALIRSTEAFIRRYKAGQRSKQARGREKVLARMKRLAPPLSNGASFLFRLECRQRSGKRVLETDGLQVRVGDRMLNAIAWGSQVRIAHFDQHQEALNPRATLYDALGARMPGALRQEIMDRLGSFGFGSDRAEEKVGTLSGGERSRLHLLAVLVSAANVLLLDEPTNHLDEDLKKSLTEALAAYQGTLVVVSHDRDFLEKAATRTWLLQDGSLHQELGLVFPALSPDESKDGGADSTVRPDRKNGPGTLSKNERFRLERKLRSIEKEIEAVEAQIRELRERFASPGDLLPGDFAALSERLRALEADKTEREESWLAISERLESDRAC
ncbi:MAG: ABC-F family ATP-binding cassette domain-containing protein [Acidobacteriota bacterium]